MSITSGLHKTLRVNSSNWVMSPLKNNGDAIRHHNDMYEYCSFPVNGHGTGGDLNSGLGDGPSAEAFQVAQAGCALLSTSEPLHNGREGYRAGQWDCTSSDESLHWTFDWERYCYKDYLRILNAVPARVASPDNGLIVTGPATVARLWYPEPA